MLEKGTCTTLRKMLKPRDFSHNDPNVCILRPETSSSWTCSRSLEGARRGAPWWSTKPPRRLMLLSETCTTLTSWGASSSSGRTVKRCGAVRCGAVKYDMICMVYSGGANGREGRSKAFLLLTTFPREIYPGQVPEASILWYPLISSAAFFFKLGLFFMYLCML